MLRDSAERMEPRFLLLLFTQVIWGLDAENRKLVEHFRELFRFAVADYGRGYTRELVLSLVNGLVYGAYEMCGAASGEFVFGLFPFPGVVPELYGVTS